MPPSSINLSLILQDKNKYSTTYINSYDICKPLSQTADGLPL